MTGLMISAIVWSVAPAGTALAQKTHGSHIQYHVSKPLDRMEMMVNTSRILTMKSAIPKLLVNNPDVLQATPLSPNQIQVSALKPGVTQLNLWDTDGNIYTVDVVVMRDATELIELLKSEFPEANLHVRPMSKSVYIKGFVPQADMVNDIVNMAKDYYDNVINGIVVGGVHQVALHVKVMEVSRTKLRACGLDWHAFGDHLSATQKVGGLAARGNGTFEFSVIEGSGQFLGYLEALRQQDLAKLLSEPTLVTMSGRPASFTSGGSFPILVPSGLGTTSIEFHDFGTRVDFVPIVLGNGMIRLEVRPAVSEPDDSRGLTLDSQDGLRGLTVPGLTMRSVDTAVELRAGQTLALAGLIQNRVEAQRRGIPYIGDLPWIGAAFSHIEETVNEVELLIVVTPEIVGPMEAYQVPQCGPGQLTTSPDDHGVYCYGYMEVPNQCIAGPAGQFGQRGHCSSCQPHGGHQVKQPQPAAVNVPTKASPQAGPQYQPQHGTVVAPPLPPAYRQGNATQASSFGNQFSRLPQSPPRQPTRQSTYKPQEPFNRQHTPALQVPTDFPGPVGYDPLY